MQYPNVFVTIKQVITILLATFLLTSNLLFFLPTITRVLNSDSQSEHLAVCTMSCCVGKPSESCCCKPKPNDDVLATSIYLDLLNNTVSALKLDLINNDLKITTSSLSGDCPCSQIGSIEQTKNIYQIKLPINILPRSPTSIKYYVYGLTLANNYAFDYQSRAPPYSPI